MTSLEKGGAGREGSVPEDGAAREVRFTRTVRRDGSFSKPTDPTT